MQTFDAALYKLYKAGRITLDEAVKNADSANNLRLRIKLGDDGGEGDASGGSMGLSLEKTDEEKAKEYQEENPFAERKAG